MQKKNVNDVTEACFCDPFSYLLYTYISNFMGIIF